MVDLGLSNPVDSEPESEHEPFRLTLEMVLALTLGVLLIIGLLIGIGLLLFRGKGSGEQVAAGQSAVDFDILTAREAYVPAVEVIRQWDAGAQLASVAGAWTPVINQAQLEAGRTGWTFHFYLPDSGQMATVVVDRGGGARVTDTQPWETPPALLSDMNWGVDSPQAISVLLDACGAVLENEPQAEVQARLSLAADNRRLLWQLQVLSAENEALCAVNVDGTTGQVR